jgi:hypothetical protein
MAYVVGLIATDGCLVGNGRHVSFDTSDEKLAVTYLTCLGRPIRYGRRRTRMGGYYYKVQFSDVALYRWLVEQGLHPRKSLTLGAVDVPDRFLAAFARGLLDGDGSIQNFVHAPTPNTYPDYRTERLWVFFTSASRIHVDWLRERLHRCFGVTGYVETRPARPPRHEFFRIKYGKRDSIALLNALYPSADVPKLDRKWAIWLDYARRNLVH